MELISKVWKIAGLVGAVVPGALVYKKEEIIFITEEGIQFQVKLSDMYNIKWPFLRMGMGFDAEVYGKKYKFSFAKPNVSAAEIKIIKGNPLPKVVSAGQYFDDVSSLLNMKTDRKTAKKWKEILTSGIKTGL
jgi:hypothetical protein